VSVYRFLARELAPSRRRFVEAARNATKTTITTGLAATFQTLGPFGPLFAFRIGQPGISLGFVEGAVTIATAAAVQAAIVPITGKLLDYPGLILAFLFMVFATLGYLLSNTRLFLILALVAVGTITTVYVGIFEPGEIGWGATYVFDGILIATLVMVTLDTSIWPSPPEPRLLESIAADLERIRARFQLLGQRYLDPFAEPLRVPEITPTLARNLMLLKSVEQQMKPRPQHLVALLDAVLTAEHVYLEVERLAVLADEPLPDHIRQNYREQIEAALRAIDEAFTATAADLIAGLSDHSPERVGTLTGTIRQLSDLNAHLSPAEESVDAEVANLLGFLDGLETIAGLLEPRDRKLDPPVAEVPLTEDDSAPHPLIDPAKFRFSVKLGAAITLGLLVGLTTQRASLQTILWSIGIVGQPNQYGAVLRKTMLRLAGCVVGGLAALAAMIVVSENFDSLPAYLVVIFAVTMFATYVAQSDEWLGYAGIQTGITFLICYVGLGPASDIYEPMWRLWGIVLGVLTAGFVFLLLWPEYAGDKVIDALGKSMRRTLDFGKEVAQGRVTDERIVATERRLSTDVLELLTMADQCRLEGRRAITNSAASIEVAATLVRIAYRFRMIARGRLSGSEALLPKTLLDRGTAIEKLYCLLLANQLAKFEPTETSEEPGLLPGALSPTDLQPMVDEFADAATLEAASWPLDARSVFVAQLESYRRLSILLASLDAQLSKIGAW
jgi:uncharacterized membrane protein YccC